MQEYNRVREGGLRSEREEEGREKERGGERERERERERGGWAEGF